MEEQGGGFGISPLQGTYIIGASNGVFALLALGVISCLGRRPIYILGQLSMATVLFICGLSVYNSWNLLSFICVNAFIMCF